MKSAEGKPISVSLLRSVAASVIASAMDAIVSVDEDQRIILFNAAAEQMFRCRAKEALGRPIDRFIPKPCRAAHRRHIQLFGSTEVTTRAMGKLGTLYGLRADGETFPVEASISQAKMGERKIFTVILRDVTANKRTETELRQREEHFRSLIEYASDLITVVNQDTILAAWLMAMVLVATMAVEVETAVPAKAAAVEIAAANPTGAD